MPGPRLEIAERFIEHLVELGEHFDDLVVRVAMIGIDIVPGPMASRSPDDRNILAAKEIARTQELRRVLQLEGDVVHMRALALHEIYGVMVGTAAHEHKPVADPVRDAESEHAAVEVR